MDNPAAAPAIGAAVGYGFGKALRRMKGFRKPTRAEARKDAAADYDRGVARRLDASVAALFAGTTSLGAVAGSVSRDLKGKKKRK